MERELGMLMAIAHCRAVAGFHGAWGARAAPLLGKALASCS